MSTPEKPRPSYDDTLHRIDAVLDAYYDPTTNTREVDVVTRITHIVDHAAKPPVVRDGNTFTINQPGVYEMTWNPGATGEPSVVEALLTERLAPPGHEIAYAELPGHRRSCQYDGPPGPGITCPGCAEIDADLAAARKVAAPAPPERGWLARALNRLFGDGAS